MMFSAQKADPGHVPVLGPTVWYGPEMAGRDDWIHVVSVDEIEEIESVVQTLDESGREIAALTPANFSWPLLGPKLREIQQEVVEGRGFALLRGLPIARWSRRQSAIAYWGIGLHFGEPVSQNAAGHLLGHVKDIGKDPRNPLHRVYQTNYRHLFHTDSCDIVGLLCLQPARRGGLSRIVSSTTLYNEMLKRRPDLVAVLEQPFYVDRKGEVPEGKAPYYELPVFNRWAGYLTTIYARDFIEAAQRFPEVPRLTPAQKESMDLLDELANDEAYHLDMDFRVGDIQMLHNHQILHARTAYEDWPEPQRKRHLLRLWLSAPNGRPLPPAFAERYGEIGVGRRRGGILVPGAQPVAPLEAE